MSRPTIHILTLMGALALLGILGSCKSLEGEAALPDLDALGRNLRVWETSLARGEILESTEGLRELRAELASLGNPLDTRDRTEAWRQGLLAWAAWRADDAAALRQISQAQIQAYPDQAWTLHSQALLLELQGKTNEAAALLETWMAKQAPDTDDTYVLAWRLHRYRALEKRPDDALSWLDQALATGLATDDDVINQYRLDLAAGAFAGLSTARALELLNLDRLTLAQWIQLSREATELLEVLGLSGKKDGEILDTLWKNRLLPATPAPDLQRAFLRRDLATLLYGLYFRSRPDPFLKKRQEDWETAISRGNIGPSPIPDLSRADPAFLAAVVMVERNILALPDGRRFLPDEPATGETVVESQRRLLSQLEGYDLPTLEP